MNPNPDTLARIREQAEVHTLKRAEMLEGVLPPLNDAERAAIRAYLRTTYLAGANAGYTAALAERRNA